MISEESTLLFSPSLVRDSVETKNMRKRVMRNASNQDKEPAAEEESATLFAV